MANPWIAALFALFVWWFATGAILMVVKRADRVGGNAHLTSTIQGLPLLALGWFGLIHTLDSDSVAAAYAAFISALAVWGWFELAFLSGVVTGPVVRPCPEGVAGWERFLRAWGTIAYSEMALIANLILIVVLCWGAPNTFGMWTFVVLFVARISAKLNIYLGVPNINVEFLPLPVRHLQSHFRIAPMNAFFPFAVTALSLVAAMWSYEAWTQPSGSAGLVGFALLAALTALAVAEHWMMVLPIPDAKLWRWLIAHSEKGVRVPVDPESAYLREDPHGVR